MEYETTNKQQAIYIPSAASEYLFIDDDPNQLHFKKELKKVVKKSIPKKVLIDEIDIKKNEEKIIEDILPELKDDDTETDIDVILKEYTPIDDDEIVNDVDFIIIEEAPVYKGCEGLTKEENKKCFIKSIQNFVVKRFNIELAQDLGLRPGKYKIFTQFVIGKDGVVKEIKIKAPHSKLKKEVNSIITKLPKFTPGMQRKVPVNVKFTLPISFNVQ
jgi:protein TonB